MTGTRPGAHDALRGSAARKLTFAHTDRPAFDGQDRNRLLRALPANDYNRVSARLELVTLPAGFVIGKWGEPLTHVYFRQTGSISMVMSPGNRSPIETALVGPEGFYGVGVLLGTGTQFNDAVSHNAGVSRRMPVDAFRDCLHVAPALRSLLLKYVHTLLAQALQSAACDSTHTVLQRCARSLLLNHDRAGADKFPLTQELLSKMLGVRRAGVTVAALTSQRAGLIRYSRGTVTILERAALEQASCPCYSLIAASYARALPEVC